MKTLVTEIWASSFEMDLWGVWLIDDGHLSRVRVFRLRDYTIYF